MFSVKIVYMLIIQRPVSLRKKNKNLMDVSSDTTVCSVHGGPTNASCNLQMIERNQVPEPRLNQKQHFFKVCCCFNLELDCD